MITVIALNETQVETVLELLQEQVREVRGGGVAVEDPEGEVRHLEDIVTAVHAGEHQEPSLLRVVDVDPKTVRTLSGL